MKIFLPLMLIFCLQITAQNFSFNFNTTGQRVCLVTAEVNITSPSVTIKLLDAASNTSHPTNIYRRQLYGNGADWTLVASNLPAGTTQWIDTNVSLGQIWEYQIKRLNTWFYANQTWNATGYAMGSLLTDKSNYQGQVILLAADNVTLNLPAKYMRLKKELTGEGWHVIEIVVPKATSWDSGNAVVGIRNQIIAAYNSAPSNDKPKMLFILGHVPMPRSGSTSVTAPDAHDQNKGARGCDAYYADVDGVYTDMATFNPGGLQTALAINNPGDFKFDQDFLPSNVEMGFGRVDFENLTDLGQTETQMMETYLDKLSNYKNVATGFDMGDKSAYYIGYDNSNDGSFRTLTSISKSANVYENTTGTPHPQWVQNNGPFKIYMQNRDVPDIGEWNTYGMNATVFSSDQSYWGYNDMPQDNAYGRIRSLLATNTKCIVTLWTTTGMNIFHQAGSGDALGLAVKEIVNYNTTNNKLEKPSQNWDTPDWWNRTHFVLNGDPTVRLYQVKPTTNLTVSNVGNQAVLSWNAAADPNIIGYHIYKSATEFGIFTRITTAPITTLNYTDANYQQNDWYMVRPIKIMESGGGKFYFPGLGIFAKGDFSLSTNEFVMIDIKVWPNPASESVTITSQFPIGAMELSDSTGRIIYKANDVATSHTIDVSPFAVGTYFIKITNENGALTKKLILK